MTKNSVTPTLSRLHSSAPVAPCSVRREKNATW